MSRGVFVFPVKGRDREGGAKCALLSSCVFELFKFCREAVGSPPLQYF